MNSSQNTFFLWARSKVEVPLSRAALGNVAGVGGKNLFHKSSRVIYDYESYCPYSRAELPS